MKKNILIILSLVLFNAIIIAQPTLTSSNFTPVIGDSQTYHIADTNSILDNNIGANVIFDYTGLQGYGQIQTQYYIDPTSTPYDNDFPLASYTDTTAGLPTNMKYSKVESTDSITNIGFVGDINTYGIVLIQYTQNPEILMKFPFNFSDSFIDDYSGVFSAQGVTTNGSGQATVNADAWGTLNLPYGVSIDSVIRIKTVENLITDTIFLQPLFPNILPIIVNAEYVNYYKPSISKFPLLSFVNGSYTQDNNVLDSSKIVITQYAITPIVNIETVNTNNFKLNLFPNPSDNNSTTLSFELKNKTHVSINIFNNLGQNIQSTFTGNLSQGINKVTINTSHLNPGLYFVSTQFNNQTITSKLIVE